MVSVSLSRDRNGNETVHRFQLDFRSTLLGVQSVYIPIVAKYLELTDEQNEQIKAACFARMKFNLEFQAKHRDINQLKQSLLTSEQWYELNYRPLTYMNQRQFIKAAVRLMESWKDRPSFTSRIEQLSSAPSLRAKCELRALGNHYRRWADLERPK